MNCPTLASQTLRHTVAAAGLLAALGASAQVAAQTYPPCDREPTQADIEGAKGAHKAAEAHYNKGAYDRAIQAWIDAYSFDCTAHRLLINIGNAQEKLGRLPEAIEAFETYLARTGEGADRTIEDKVANLKARLQQQQTPPVPTATASGSGDLPPPPPPPDGQPAEGPGIGPWIVVGAGGAVTVLGIVLLAVGSSKKSEAEGKCDYDPAGEKYDCSNTEDPTGYADLGETGRVMTGSGAAGIGVGLAAVAGGLLWYFLASSSAGEQDKSAEGAWVRPMVSPWATGVSVAGAF